MSTEAKSGKRPDGDERVVGLGDGGGSWSHFWEGAAREVIRVHLLVGPGEGHVTVQTVVTVTTRTGSWP